MRDIQQGGAKHEECCRGDEHGAFCCHGPEATHEDREPQASSMSAFFLTSTSSNFLSSSTRRTSHSKDWNNASLPVILLRTASTSSCTSMDSRWRTLKHTSGSCTTRSWRWMITSMTWIPVAADVQMFRWLQYWLDEPLVSPSISVVRGGEEVVPLMMTVQEDEVPLPLWVHSQRAQRSRPFQVNLPSDHGGLVRRWSHRGAEREWGNRWRVGDARTTWAVDGPS